MRGQRARPARAALPVGAVARGRRVDRGLDRGAASRMSWGMRACNPTRRRSYSTAPTAASMPASSTTSRAAWRATQALRDDVLVAYAMNGAPLPPQHGAPLRLVVPRWYGMASVKWLRAIEALDQPFDGFQQARSYHFRRAAGDKGEPCTLMRVNSAHGAARHSGLLYAPAHCRRGDGRDRRPRMVGRGADHARGIRRRRRVAATRRRSTIVTRSLAGMERVVAGERRRARALLPRHRCAPAMRSRSSRRGTCRASATTACSECKSRSGHNASVNAPADRALFAQILNGSTVQYIRRAPC